MRCMNCFDMRIESTITKKFNFFVHRNNTFLNNVLTFDFVVQSVRQFANETRCLIDV